MKLKFIPKKLILILSIVLVGYGCEKIEPKILIPYPDLNDILKYGEVASIVNDLKKESGLDILDAGKWTFLEASVHGIESVTSIISTLNMQFNFYKQSIEYKEIKMANFIYDSYMKYLEQTVMTGNHQDDIIVQLQVLDQAESNPNFRVIVRNNLNLTLELLEKLEKNYYDNIPKE